MRRFRKPFFFNLPPDPDVALLATLPFIDCPPNEEPLVECESDDAPVGGGGGGARADDFVPPPPLLLPLPFRLETSEDGRRDSDTRCC